MELWLKDKVCVSKLPAFHFRPLYKTTFKKGKKQDCTHLDHNYPLPFKYKLLVLNGEKPSKWSWSAWYNLCFKLCVFLFCCCVAVETPGLLNTFFLT